MISFFAKNLNAQITSGLSWTLVWIAQLTVFLA